MKKQDFSEYFRRATGGEHGPYEYQRALGEMKQPPAVLAVPTGSGKTRGLLISWLYGRRVRGSAPRRLVYALPMRALVEQTAREAQAIRTNLNLDEQDLGIHVLMGGVERAELQDWRRRPEQDQILIGTVDMLLSGALNRGYAESRFAWPISFGLLNADCRWVFDEVQLMGVAAKTAAQLDGLRRRLGVARPCQSVWVSATVDEQALVTVDRPELGEILRLPPADAKGGLRGRLEAQKRLERVDLTGRKPSETAGAIAQAVAERHRAGTRSIVVVNRVELAQETLRALDRILDGDARPQTVLLHSRFRPEERRQHMDAALADIDPDGPGRIVVSTQVIEAGVDTSCALLATEIAPFASIVQRAGRCNRSGEIAEGARILWLDRGELDAKAAAPYEPAELEFARGTLLGLLGQSLSPNRLGAMELPPRDEATATLRRRDLIDLFDTAPDLSGMDVDVSRFIREDDERSISVFFRELGEDEKLIAEQPAALREELVQVPIESLGERDAWIHDHVEGRWRKARGRAIRPGMTVMLAAAGGGYDERLGWEPKVSGSVAVLAPKDGQPEESFGSDTDTFIGEWVTLREHLEDAHVCALELLDAVGELDVPAGTDRAVKVAASLHDVGKAHPAFQEMLRGTVEDEACRAQLERTLWAKSARGGGRNERRHFRHELASALALLALDQADRPLGLGELALYLIAAHHGRVRMSIRPAPEEKPALGPRAAPTPRGEAPRFALGILEGDELPAVDTPLGPLAPVVLDLTCMEMGGGRRSWTEAACGIRDDPALGPFRIAYLEALVRVADWRASAQPHIAAARTTGADARVEPPAGRSHEKPEGDEAHAPLAIAGCTPDTLMNYLKALGLLRVVSRQADAQARGRWRGGTFELSCALGREALHGFLIERYTPTPVVSPWNGGSGFFPKDNKRAMDAIEASADPRVEPLRRAMADAHAALSTLDLAEKPGEKKVKLRLLRELRARFADDALEWLDAAAALLGDRVEYPPLLGSGGNDGRYDFANNYAQAVVTALGLAGTAKARNRAQSLLAAALDRTPAQLEQMSAGHFLRDSSPVNSPSGESDGLGNPWDLVLAVEGCLLLSAGAARRHGVVSDTTMVAPFTVHPTAAGYGSAVAGEKGRAELWLPLWEAWTGLAELEAVTREARAQVGRRNARSGLDFARSCGEMAVARGIEGFARFALLERAGQSTLAVPAGRVEVRERPAVAALRTIDQWLARLQGYARSDPGRAVREAVNRLERDIFALAEHGDAASACRVLERLGEVESILAASAAGDSQDGVLPLGKAPAAVWLAAADDGSAEFALAASLASLHDHAATAALPAMRDYLHGTSVDAQGHRTYAGRPSRAAPRRAGAIERLALIHRRRHLDVESLLAEHGNADGSSRRLSFARGIYCPLALAGRFAHGDRDLDDARVMRLVEGLALLDFSFVSQAPRHIPSEEQPTPAFELLSLAWAGGAALAEHSELQPRPGWTGLLASDQPDALARVLEDAHLRLRMSGLAPLLSPDDLHLEALSGHRAAAALLLRVHPRELRATTRKLVEPLDTQVNEGALS